MGDCEIGSSEIERRSLSLSRARAPLSRARAWMQRECVSAARGGLSLGRACGREREYEARALVFGDVWRCALSIVGGIFSAIVL